VQSYDDRVNTWFSEAIGRPCTLVRCSSSKYRSCTYTGLRDRPCRDTQSKLNFVNEGQLLLISEESISDLNSRLNSGIQPPSFSALFIFTAKGPLLNHRTN
jgi:molybdenum cofactor sulfurtransferase